MQEQHVGTPEPTVPRRGLGPFSGGQLTAIVIAVVVAIALPVGAYGVVSGSNAFITDHLSGVHASVATTGSLQTTAVPPTGGQIVIGADADGSRMRCGFYTPPKGKAFVITGIQLVPLGAAPGNEVGLGLWSDEHAACAGPQSPISLGQFTSDTPEWQSLDPGPTLRSGQYLDFSATGGIGVEYASAVFLYGYYVPESMCAKGCAQGTGARSSALLRLLHLMPRR